MPRHGFLTSFPKRKTLLSLSRVFVLPCAVYCCVALRPGAPNIIVSGFLVSLLGFLADAFILKMVITSGAALSALSSASTSLTSLPICEDGIRLLSSENIASEIFVHALLQVRCRISRMIGRCSRIIAL